MLSVYGQVVHRRRLSSRLLFYDLLLVDEDPAVVRAVAADVLHAAERESPEAMSELALLKQAAQGVELMIKADGHTKGRMPIEAVRRDTSTTVAWSPLVHSCTRASVHTSRRVAARWVRAEGFFLQNDALLPGGDSVWVGFTGRLNPLWAQ
jgi:hypothetical protein